MLQLLIKLFDSKFLKNVAQIFKQCIDFDSDLFDFQRSAKGTQFFLQLCQLNLIEIKYLPGILLQQIGTMFWIKLQGYFVIIRRSTLLHVIEIKKKWVTNLLQFNIEMQEMDEQKPADIPKRSIPNILVTGTPGTGKTTLATLLNTTLNFTYINIGKLVSEQKLYKQWDYEFNCSIFDEDMVLDYVEEKYPVNSGGLIIDFHSSDFFPLRYFDLVILVRCNNQILYKRLEERGYDQKKIMENIDCQILQVTHDEVFQAYPAQIILQLNNEQKEDVQKNLEIVIEWLQNWKQRRRLELQLEAMSNNAQQQQL